VHDLAVEKSLSLLVIILYFFLLLSSTLVYYLRRYGIGIIHCLSFFSVSLCRLPFTLPTVFYFSPTLICIIPLPAPERSVVVNKFPSLFFLFLFLFLFSPFSFLLFGSFVYTEIY